MDQARLLTLFADVAAGRLTPDAAVTQLRIEPYRELQHGLCLDAHRCLRTGEGEVVFGRNKTPEQLIAAVGHLAEGHRPVLATKLSIDQGKHLKDAFPHGIFSEPAGLFSVNKPLNLNSPWPNQGECLIITAGSSDLSIGLEALGTAQFYDLSAGLITDVGVAGLHRLIPHVSSIFEAKLCIVVAGMEGALPSVLAGMTGKPIIAVPSSVGYGANLGGLAPLLAMLNACAPGISVVNIDNGFGAAVMAAKLISL